MKTRVALVVLLVVAADVGDGSDVLLPTFAWNMRATAQQLELGGLP